MRRRLFIVGGALTLAPSLAHAEQERRIARIGVLEAWAPSAFPHRLQAFRDGLRELGHVEGQTFVIEYRSAAGDGKALPALAAELTRLEVDIIFAATTSTALSAKDATRTIPIVIAVVAEPIGTGLIASLAHPGGNVTGLTTANTEITAKRMQLLHEFVGGASRVGLLFNPEDASNLIFRKNAELGARTLGVAVRLFEAVDQRGIAAAFSRMEDERLDALMIAAGQLMDSEAKLITALAAKYRLPAIYGAPEFVEAGGLMSYSASFTDNFRRAAAYVDKLLKGAQPGNIPVEQASTFEFILNRKVATALGREVPPSFLIQATRIIE